MLTEDARKRPDEQAADCSGHDPVGKWEHYVEQILLPIAVCDGGERDARRSAAGLDDGEIASPLKLAKRGNEPREGEAAHLTALDEVEEGVVPIVGLYEVKDSLLLSVQAHEALLLCHVMLLVMWLVAMATS